MPANGKLSEIVPLVKKEGEERSMNNINWS
jgi:hypothetical protein